MRFSTGFAPAGVCYDPVTLTALAVTAAVASAGAQVYSGFAANQAYKDEAGLQREQAALARQESIVSAQDTAAERTKLLRRQQLAFTKSGVTLEGSPLLVLDETKVQSQKEVNAILRRGEAQYRLGQRSADITRNKGRAALIGGFTGAVGTLSSAGFSAAAVK